ncbi:MAG: CHAT domain-containing protein, partial [Gaiellales bacterium]
MLNYARFGEMERLMESQIPDIASARTADLWWLCHAYAELKRYNKLFLCLDQMERNIAKGDRELNVSTSSLHGISVLFFSTDATYYPSLWRAQALAELQDYEKAVIEAEKGVALAEASSEQPKKHLFMTVPPRSVLEKLKGQGLSGVIHAALGHRLEAQRLVQAVEQFETDVSMELPGAADKKKATKAEQLGKMYMALKDYERAYQASDYAVPWGAAFGQAIMAGAGEEGEEYATSYRVPQKFIRAKSAYETKRTAEAKQGYDELLKHPRIKSFGELYWLVLFDRGRIEEASNRKGAIPYYVQAVEVIEHQRSTINTEVNKIGFVGDKQQVYHHLISALLAEGQAAQAFEYVERAKARALVDLLASKKDFSAPASEAQQVAKLIQALDAADLEAAAAQTPEAPTKDIATTPVGGQTVRSARGVQVREQLKTAAPELATLVTVTQTNTNEIQALLRPGEVLLEYYYEGDDLAVFILDRTQIRGIKLPGAGLSAEIADFRKALEETKSDRYRVISNKLYDRLIAPVGSYMTGKQVLIVPHGALHYLPFSALCSAKDCLIDRASLRLLPSASVLPFLKGRKQQEGGALLALGNPDLGDPKYDL